MTALVVISALVMALFIGYHFGRSAGWTPFILEEANESGGVGQARDSPAGVDNGTPHPAQFPGQAPAPRRHRSMGRETR